MKIHSATFICSSPDLQRCPPPDLPEYAFIGRSNVGKSSLINMITDRKGLAKISGKPGKTRLINHFLMNETWYLVDLPGYGFAKLSKSVAEKWDKMIRDYLTRRKNLLSVFLLIDARLEMQNNDREFMEWLAVNEIPFLLLFTKTDKLGVNQLSSNMASYKRTLLKSWETLPPCILSSSVTKKGKEEILDYIEKTNPLFPSSL
ncbi:MAG: YihA family ribosome biogenesis GTP-binding protein [Bacteroidia bacterium]|nr:ribosome biogenesis GTP-binding protein YihA/YsxC [Bacteroidales bacterium]NCD42414.1 YihA family ribosome biogenesis GTP-binding protein [Bacteroidia bacterium]MDD2322378.1 ribosome biogenesis GTP-binding protein YihA/YsxC [Bacteroidales bacterium]MDD3960916.1 ribosome biogenesis GTP-binding protein YihA/YsxC [Bacteroidales bacterium]MDY0287121.1 ribosome biogenesis GTP-binding protein YihA/YsxC [Bacteroidales bacterium]